jgi:hypothetical protein
MHRKKYVAVHKKKYVVMHRKKYKNIYSSLMHDRIETEIKSNNLEAARIEIQKLEDTILTEKSDYVRCKIQEKVNKYKEIYSSKIQINGTDLQKNTYKIEKPEETNKCKDLLVYENKLGETVYTDYIYSSGRISNCKNCSFEYIEITESLVIENCTDCIFRFRTGQCRLKNSYNIKLEVYIESGISLEECNDIEISEYEYKNVKNIEISEYEYKNVKNIEISEYEYKNVKNIEKDHNNYKNVKDFTNPFGNTNYRFI